MGRMFGLSANEIGICSCSSEAYNLAAMALRLQPDHGPSLGSAAGVVHLEDLASLLGPRTRLVTTSLVSFYKTL